MLLITTFRIFNETYIKFLNTGRKFWFLEELTTKNTLLQQPEIMFDFFFSHRIFGLKETLNNFIKMLQVERPLSTFNTQLQQLCISYCYFDKFVNRSAINNIKNSHSTWLGAFLNNKIASYYYHQKVIAQKNDQNKKFLRV